MTPARYAKIKAVADDERADPETRAAAQRQVEKWRIKMEDQAPAGLHPGRRQSPEYRAWVKGLHVGSKREPGR
jgi:hypothetical protein